MLRIAKGFPLTIRGFGGKCPCLWTTECVHRDADGVGDLISWYRGKRDGAVVFLRVGQGILSLAVMNGEVTMPIGSALLAGRLF